MTGWTKDVSWWYQDIWDILRHWMIHHTPAHASMPHIHHVFQHGSFLDEIPWISIWFSRATWVYWRQNEPWNSSMLFPSFLIHRYSCYGLLQSPGSRVVYTVTPITVYTYQWKSTRMLLVAQISPTRVLEMEIIFKIWPQDSPVFFQCSWYFYVVVFLWNP